MKPAVSSVEDSPPGHVAKLGLLVDRHAVLEVTTVIHPVVEYANDKNA